MDRRTDASKSVQIRAGTQEEFARIWGKLNKNQQRFCVARLHCATDAAAAQEVGISDSTVRSWPAPTKQAISQAVSYMLADAAGAAMAMLYGALDEAIA